MLSLIVTLMPIYFLSVSARLDYFAELINQQDQVIAENSKKIQSLACSLDQFKVNTEAQLLPKLMTNLKYCLMCLTCRQILSTLQSLL